jgi:predicted O-methyltransferase YrrM
VRSIVEIGVRAGYSAFAFLCAVPEAHYLGIDADRGEWGGQEGFFEYAQTTTLREFDNVEFMRTSSLDLHSLPEEYDFAHIDGDHSYTGAWHDLNLCASCSQVMMVDDYDMIFSVRAAVDHWLVQYTKTWAGAYYGDPNGRSSMLLMRRQNV